MQQTGESNVVSERKRQFEESVAKLRDRLFRKFYRLTGDADLASDLAQEAIYRLLLYMNGNNWSKNIKYLDAFATKIARNCLFDLWRKQRNKRFVSLDHDEDGAVLKEVDQVLLSNGEFAGVDAEQLDQLREEIPLQMILHEISEADRKLFYLHIVEDLSPKKIAKRTGENADSIRYQLTKIKAKIGYRAQTYLKMSGKKSLF
ncbi:MAG TPA: RNA polymerase sigma factor [Pyrinomonadaceae bacterium]|nr:RNA polymerase sigma factor [Pyrinomonadaceae bacterium]